MLRITASVGTFALIAGPAELVSPILSLTDFVSSGVQIRPTAITHVEEGANPADLTISQLVIRSTKNPDEIAHRLYKGPDVPLAAVMGALSRDALKSSQLTPLHFTADHGAELVFTYKNPTAEHISTFLWDVQNSHKATDRTHGVPDTGSPSAQRGVTKQEACAKAALCRNTPNDPGTDTYDCNSFCVCFPAECEFWCSRCHEG